MKGKDLDYLVAAASEICGTNWQFAPHRGTFSSLRMCRRVVATALLLCGIYVTVTGGVADHFGFPQIVFRAEGSYARAVGAFLDGECDDLLGLGDREDATLYVISVGMV
jgi:hypothetical protein